MLNYKQPIGGQVKKIKKSGIFFVSNIKFSWQQVLGRKYKYKYNKSSIIYHCYIKLYPARRRLFQHLVFNTKL